MGIYDDMVEDHNDGDSLCDGVGMIYEEGSKDVVCNDEDRDGVWEEDHSNLGLFFGVYLYLPVTFCHHVQSNDVSCILGFLLSWGIWEVILIHFC